MKDTNGKANNSQRKVLAKLAVDLLDKKIQHARDESGQLTAQIRQQVREELGVMAMDLEIEEMEKRIKILEKKKEELGFGKYQDQLLPGSQAKTLVERRTETACEKVRELEDKKTDVASGIWAAATLEQALSILNSVKTL
jgi:hypothetical protein